MPARLEIAVALITDVIDSIPQADKELLREITTSLIQERHRLAEIGVMSSDSSQYIDMVRSLGASIEGEDAYDIYRKNKSALPI